MIDVEPGRREKLGGYAAAGAAADDDDIGIECPVGREFGCVNMFPA